MKTTSKSQYKSEMARKYGMSLNTFTSWLKRIPGLSERGYYTRIKLLPPNLVDYIDKHLGGGPDDVDHFNFK